MRIYATALLNSKRMRRVTQVEIGTCCRARKPNIYLDAHRAWHERYVVRENRGQERLIYLGRVFPKCIYAAEGRLIYLCPQANPIRDAAAAYWNWQEAANEKPVAIDGAHIATDVAARFPFVVAELKDWLWQRQYEFNFLTRMSFPTSVANYGFGHERGCQLTMRLSDAGLHRRPTKLIYPDHRLPPWLNEDATRDRSNRLLEGRVLERPKYRVHSRLVPGTLRLKPMHYIGIKT
jgi:hypothetical protein